MQGRDSLLKLLKEPLETGNIQLPPFDATALKIQQEASRKEPDTALIEKLITSDQALTSEVLKMANSSFYHGLTTVTTVHNAVVRLGIQEVANMAVLSTQRGRYKAGDPYISGLMRDLWRHSVGCAIAANWICKKIGATEHLSEAFFAGLLHDVGKLFLLTMLDKIKLGSDTPMKMSDAFVLELTNSPLHTTHGHKLLNIWNLPGQYSGIARDHHAEGVDKENVLLTIVQVGNRTCNNLGIGLRQDPSVSLVATEQVQRLGLSEIDLAKLEIRLEDSKMLAG